MTDTGARQSARRRCMEPRVGSRAPTSPPMPGHIGPGRVNPPADDIAGYPLALIHQVTSLDKPCGGEQE